MLRHYKHTINITKKDVPRFNTVSANFKSNTEVHHFATRSLILIVATMREDREIKYV